MSNCIGPDSVILVWCNVECSQTTVEAGLEELVWDLKLRLLGKAASVSQLTRIRSYRKLRVFTHYTGNPSCGTPRK